MAGQASSVVLLAALLAHDSGRTAASAPTTGQQNPIGMLRSLVERSHPPVWLALPPSADLVIPSGSKIEAVALAIVSNETIKQAALVGVLRNAGRPLARTRLTLAYIAADGSRIGAPVVNAAHVSEIPTNDLLPFKLPLLPKSSVSADVPRFRLSLEEGVAGRRPIKVTLREGYSIHDSRQHGSRIEGEVAIEPEPVPAPGPAPVPAPGPAPGAERHAAATRPDVLLLTLALYDKGGRLLDIVSGQALPDPVSGHYRFRLFGTAPAAGATRDIRAWAEAEASPLVEPAPARP